MKIKTPKYKNAVLLTTVICILIMLFEIIPGYYDSLSRFALVIYQSFSGETDENLTKKISLLKQEQFKLKRAYSGQLDLNEEYYSFSSALEKFSVDDPDFELSINTVKPLKKIKKGRLEFQRISLGISSDYENIYNYCRWLELSGSAIEFDEIKINKQKQGSSLNTTIILDILYSREHK